MQPTPVSLPGKSQGQRGLEGCNPWGFKESGTTERLTLTIDEWKKKMWGAYTHTRSGILKVIKNNETLPFVTTWMVFKNIILSEMSQRKISTI